MAQNKNGSLTLGSDREKAYALIAFGCPDQKLSDDSPLGRVFSETRLNIVNSFEKGRKIQAKLKDGGRTQQKA